MVLPDFLHCFDPSEDTALCNPLQTLSPRQNLFQGSVRASSGRDLAQDGWSGQMVKDGSNIVYLSIFRDIL